MVILCLLGTSWDIYQRYKVDNHPKLVHCINDQGPHLVSTEETMEETSPVMPSDDSGTASLPEWNKPPDSNRVSRAFRTKPGKNTHGAMIYSPLFMFCGPAIYWKYICIICKINRTTS